jgi:hypothetical protein
MNNYLDDNAKYCCLDFKEMLDDGIINGDEDGYILGYFNRKQYDINYCPNCGAKL